MPKPHDLIGNGFITNYKFSLNNIEFYNSMFFTNNRSNAIRGYVREIKDVTMYTNQAYVLAKLKSSSGINLNIKIGRFFNKIGYGLGANLFLSSYSRPYDQFSIRLKYENLISSLSAIELDENKIDSNIYNRYLMLHTFKYNYKNLEIVVGESVLYSGINKSIELKYLNPFHLWSWENTGSGVNGLNAILFLSVKYKLKKNSSLHTEVLVDDINFHRKNADYLNRYGFLIGFNKVGFPFDLSNYWIEYSSVLSQVYQSFHPTHDYLHRNFPIGHYLGNDFKMIRFHFENLLNNSKAKVVFDLAYIIDGSNGIDSPFKTPWINEDGALNPSYEFPGHPSPPVLRKLEYDISLEYSFYEKNYLFLSLNSFNQFSISDDIIDRSFTKISFGFWSYIHLR